ncbi:Transcription-repair coupling factor [Methylophaga frappieri]|uniref:Transcription-repair-coupling factor n=1 Tax=Methylophaga frappieri (strain ATCC BAA-2434 / DSM 25690 / JAM7) TaxID=754477 RepID=I1YH51_METFJ|nr:transcription-repair coupling factor [Methylophaga frappieri]AFJ02244.1 Transcription-repair coupling factor [Methylophaga frappieri]
MRGGNLSASLLQPELPLNANDKRLAGQLYGSAAGLLLANAALQHDGPLLVITDDMTRAQRLETEIRFYLGAENLPILHFPDWETLPYDTFSPHQDIISERLQTLHQLPDFHRGILLVPVATIMQRIAPAGFLEGHRLQLAVGDTLDIDSWRLRLEKSGYRHVSQVVEHGEFAVRGAIIDLYPMGSRWPYRIDLFDDEIDTLRTFDPETQRSVDTIDRINLLPAREFPVNEDSIKLFRQQYRTQFDGDPQKSLIYREVSEGNLPGGIEFYLPLFFEQTACLTDYLPENTLLIHSNDTVQAAEAYWQEIDIRYQQHRVDPNRPLLPPTAVFVPVDDLFARFKRWPRLQCQNFELEAAAAHHNYASVSPPQLTLNSRQEKPCELLENFLASFDGRVLIAAESAGRRETLLDLLRKNQLQAKPIDNWQAFLNDAANLCITVAPLEQGLYLPSRNLAVIAETQLFGQQVMQRRRRSRKKRDSDAIIRNLAELSLGDAVVHEDHGVGRYLGLQKLDVGDVEAEYVTLEYAKGDKLYVPVASLELISRYSGAAPELAPLHQLGTTQWEKARRRAAEKARDVAAELLDIYAKRAANKKDPMAAPDNHYDAFSAAFSFETTPDQQDAIDAVVADLQSDTPMDRLICGDVGFGKTEVAMRAAFLTVQSGKQVLVLVPTTLLAQQHYENFKDRFADWPVKVEVLSRFRSKKQLDNVKSAISDGTADIIIGTHKLLQQDIQPKRLGLFVLDEEHRFGVTQKEQLKKYRTHIDVLTLTATPIPRTLNMSISGIRDLSIIATAPARRLAIKTFVLQWQADKVREGMLREIKRGGQVYYLYNKVEDIDRVARELESLMPEARIGIAHGQMRERELEQVMLDFYHQRFNVLVCTTIIETGIDVPSANTIFIDRADKLGLAQLYQIRGRVGRSHHRAYAYLITPPQTAMTSDAIKRLEAIESIEDLGAGFTLATHDMEIRGAGELLGDEQSGQMQEIGFGLYNEILERAVKALKSGQTPSIDTIDRHMVEIDLHVPALIPSDYLPDVHNRLVLYKRIAAAPDKEALHELQVEMVDRFGLLPDQVKTLFAVHEMRLKAKAVGIRKIDVYDQGGRLIFDEKPHIEPIRIIELIQKQPSRFKLDGQDKLKFSGDMPDADSRIVALDNLLDSLLAPAA